MFVFDVSDTEPIPGAPEIPIEVEKPFEVSSGMVKKELDRTILNAIRDGIEITSRKEGSLSAGSIEKTSEKEPKTLSFPHGRDEDGNQIYKTIPVGIASCLTKPLAGRPAMPPWPTNWGTSIVGTWEHKTKIGGRIEEVWRRWWPNSRPRRSPTWYADASELAFPRTGIYRNTWGGMGKSPQSARRTS